MPEADFNKAVEWNKTWLKTKIDSGYKIVDIGPDGRANPSAFYQAELDILKETKTPKVLLKKLEDGRTIEDVRKKKCP